MRVTFDDDAWEDYLYFQKTDKALVKKINALVKECRRTPFKGIGKPEPLKNNWSGYWSRRINHEHRFIYKVNDGEILIAQCRYHY